jgi:hypothetical protein
LGTGGLAAGSLAASPALSASIFFKSLKGEKLTGFCFGA